jgi:hypothetical protein
LERTRGVRSFFNLAAADDDEPKIMTIVLGRNPPADMNGVEDFGKRIATCQAANRVRSDCNRSVILTFYARSPYKQALSLHPPQKRCS